MLSLVAWVALCRADPWEDGATWGTLDEGRAQAWDQFLGVQRLDPLTLARRAQRFGGGEVRVGGLAESAIVAAPGWSPLVVVRPRGTIEAGNLDPINMGGDAEGGWAGLAVTVDGRLYSGPFSLVLAPEVEGSGGPWGASARLDEAAVTVASGGYAATFGQQDRWLGPGRHGALVLSDNAVAPWMGALRAEGHLGRKLYKLGRFRGEFGLGWLGRPRTDVTRPGLLLLDLRYLPVPMVEVGATRMALFGGVGRPPVDIGQLFLPTEPHVYEDPDLSEPDQNELAALDFRLTLPIAHWWGGPVRHVEAWWQYGGEDVIARKSAGIPYPALAGVANLYGGEVAVGPVNVTVEYSRLMDDYFRWYVGHRVYHAGFTQDGRPMGVAGGTDSETLWGAVSLFAGAARTRISVEHLRRVGVIEALNDRVFTFPVEENHVRLGLQGDAPVGTGRMAATVEVDRVTGAGFLPGPARVDWRASIAFELQGVWRLDRSDVHSDVPENGPSEGGALATPLVGP